MEELLKKVDRLDQEKLVEVHGNKVVLVGDTHGDLEASRLVVDKFLEPNVSLVFLGDYVDRGPNSEENVKFLLERKLENPDQIYLLQGNHEGYPFLNFSPADFWNSLDRKRYEIYECLFKKLPLAASFDGGLAVHGALPDLDSLEQINRIQLGDEHWKRIVWGDFVTERDTRTLLSSRPQFDEEYFRRKMEDFDKEILIRSHQPNCPQTMYDERCITVFTSSTYVDQRAVVVFRTESGNWEVVNF